MNTKDLILLVAIGYAVYLGYQESNKPATPDAGPTTVAAPAGTAANFGFVCGSMADAFAADGQVEKPVALYSADVLATYDAWFKRPYAANIASGQSANIAALRAKILETCGPIETPLATDKRAALVQLLRTTAAANR